MREVILGITLILSWHNFLLPEERQKDDCSIAVNCITFNFIALLNQGHFQCNKTNPPYLLLSMYCSEYDYVAYLVKLHISSAIYKHWLDSLLCLWLLYGSSDMPWHSWSVKLQIDFCYILNIIYFVATIPTQTFIQNLKKSNCALLNVVIYIIYSDLEVCLHYIVALSSSCNSNPLHKERLYIYYPL